MTAISKSTQSILLVYKDELKKSKIFGDPLGQKSESILNHLEVAKKNGELINVTKKEDLIQFLNNYYEDINKVKIEKDCFLWGWWKKSGENYNEVFDKIQNDLSNNLNIDAYLYNQYTYQIYKAKLHYIFRIPHFDTIQLPNEIKSFCPASYHDEPHLCGCFFVLSFVKDKTNDNDLVILDPDKVFSELRLDAISFNFGKDLDKERFPNGISEIIDLLYKGKISRYDLKAKNQTIYVLEQVNQIEIIRELLKNKVSRNIKEYFKFLRREDILTLLLEMQT
ncbi:MAG: hypothetical protein ACFFDN_49955, partial [Candidatus Hodarchaeota archaeon]